MRVAQQDVAAWTDKDRRAPILAPVFQRRVPEATLPEVRGRQEDSARLRRLRELQLNVDAKVTGRFALSADRTGLTLLSDYTHTFISIAG
jgi:hypothetical protein